MYCRIKKNIANTTWKLILKTWTSRRKEYVEHIEIVETVETNDLKAQNEKLGNMTTRPIIKCIFLKKTYIR